jgi:large subunit ribosomal protein L23
VSEQKASTQEDKKMVWNRVRFPNMAITFMGKNARTRLRDNQYVFRVEPNYTKHDIKEYLTKVYDLPVVKVNTMNYEGLLNKSIE